MSISILARRSFLSSCRVKEEEQFCVCSLPAVFDVGVEDTDLISSSRCRLLWVIEQQDEESSADLLSNTEKGDLALVYMVGDWIVVAVGTISERLFGTYGRERTESIVLQIVLLEKLWKLTLSVCFSPEIFSIKCSRFSKQPRWACQTSSSMTCSYLKEWNWISYSFDFECRIVFNRTVPCTGRL